VMERRAVALRCLRLVPRGDILLLDSAMSIDQESGSNSPTIALLVNIEHWSGQIVAASWRQTPVPGSSL
jgi:hypothetical protein